MKESQNIHNRQSDAELDASGLYCPLPVLRAKKALDQMSDNSVLKLIATDPGSKLDVEAFTDQAGYKLIDTEQSDDQFIFYIEKTIN